VGLFDFFHINSKLLELKQLKKPGLPPVSALALIRIKDLILTLAPLSAPAFLHFMEGADSEKAPVNLWAFQFIPRHSKSNSYFIPLYFTPF